MRHRSIQTSLCMALLLVTGCSTMRMRGGTRIATTRPLGFGIAAPVRGIDGFLDDRLQRNGLVASFTRTSPYAFSNDTGRFHECLYGKMGYLDDQAYTYDLALAVIGMLLLGRQDDAENILSALEKDFYLPKNGRKGLYNCYLVSSAIPVSDLEMGGDGDRMHAGPLLWVALAALNHTKVTRNTRYLEFSLDIVDWCRSELTYYRFPDGERGAISMGFGWGPDWSTIFSTEHNIDYFAVLKILHDIYAESPDDVRRIFNDRGISEAWLEDEMGHIGRWLANVAFNEEHYCFVAGVNQFGVDSLRILDGTSWGLGGVGPEEFASWGIDLDRLVASTERYFRSSYTLPDGRVIYGFDITDPQGYDHQRDPLVWFEGTGQMIIALGVLADYFAKLGDEERAASYNNKAAAYTRDMYLFARAFGLEGRLPYMSIRPAPEAIVKTLKWEWEIPRGRTPERWVESMSSTMWFLYCIADFYNPMRWTSPLDGNS